VKVTVDVKNLTAFVIGLGVVGGDVVGNKYAHEKKKIVRNISCARKNSGKKCFE